MASLGDTFRLADRDTSAHLHIMISDPVKDPDHIVTVNFTSWQAHKDQSCVVEKGEHRSISKRSCVHYRKTTPHLITLAQYEQFVATRQLIPDDPVSPDLLQRVLQGAAMSRFLALGSRQILVNQGLIDCE
jgi:hypothetical protein